MSWLTRKAFALLLAAFVAVGLSLSAVQANDMAVKMGMTSAMDMSGSNDCGGCPDKTSDKSGMAACLFVCVTPVTALAPPAPFAVAAVSHDRPPLLRYQALPDRHLPPDPYPPRPSDIA